MTTPEISEKPKSQRIINDAVKYTGASYFSNAFDFITGVVIRKALGPTFMGLFSELMLIFRYTKESNLGILNALDREIPIYNGKEDYAKVKQISDIGFNFSIFSSSSISLMIIIAALLLRQYYDSRLVIGIIIICILTIIQAALSFFIVYIRTHHNFTLLSRYLLLYGILSMALKIFLVIRFGLYGLLWAFVISGLIAIIYLSKRSGNKFNFKIKLHLRELGRLIKIGLPILFSGIVLTTLCNMDRFFIIKFLGETQLGYYSIATMFHNYIYLMPNFISVVLFPRFYEKYGERNNIQDLKEDYIKPTLIFAYFSPIIIGLVTLVLPVLLRYVLPKFSPGLIPAVILIFGTFFLCIINMSGYLLIALNKQYHLVLIGICSVVISAVLNYLFVKKFDLGLNGIAFAMFFTYFIYGTGLISYAFSHYKRKLIEHLSFFLMLYIPIIWISCVSFIISSLFAYNFSSIQQDIAIALVRVIILLIASSPLILYVQKRTKILNMAWRIIQSSSILFKINRNL